MKDKSRNARQIAGKRVLIQSCWVDEALDIVANIHIFDGKFMVHHRRVEISGEDEITYPMFTPYMQIGPHMTHEEFDCFLNDCLGEVLGLIFSLLEPEELERIKLTGPEI